MKKIALGSLLGCMAAAGCGAVPEILVETAKSSAKDEIDERLDEVISDFTGEILDLDQLDDWIPEDEEDE